MSIIETNKKETDINITSKVINAIATDIKELTVNDISNTSNISNTSDEIQYVSEIRVGIIGSVDSGKSTLTGVLTKNILDDGRGSARSLILKHAHEQESGRTSCISQHHIKYQDETNILKSIVSLVDLAGHEKYLKTTITGMKRCMVDYAGIVVAANMGVLPMTKEHICLAMGLRLPIFIVLSKIDMSPENVTQNTIKNIYATFKKISKKRKLVMIKTQQDLIQVFEEYKNKQVISIPIFSSSSVSGEGVDLLKYYLSNLNAFNQYQQYLTEVPNFIVDCVYHIKGVGIVVSGILAKGIVNKGDVLMIGPIFQKFIKITVRSIHNNFKQNINTLYAGQGGCFDIKAVSNKEVIKRSQLRRGIRILSEQKAILTQQFDAYIKILQHPTTIKINYQPTIHCDNVTQCAQIVKMDKDYLRLGDTARVSFKFCYHPEYIEIGGNIIFREGKCKGIGKVINVN